MNVTVSLRDALIGFTMEVTHLDGHKVKNDYTLPLSECEVISIGTDNP